MLVACSYCGAVYDAGVTQSSMPPLYTAAARRLQIPVNAQAALALASGSKVASSSRSTHFRLLHGSCLSRWRSKWCKSLKRLEAVGPKRVRGGSGFAVKDIFGDELSGDRAKR